MTVNCINAGRKWMNANAMFTFKSNRVGIIVLVVLIQCFSSFAQKGSPRDFDFWVGQWEIDQKILGADGKWIELMARTRVEKDLDGLALIEHWSGDVQFFWEGMTSPAFVRGFSIRSFDSTSGQWNIYWCDTRNPSLGKPFTGAFENGIGKFIQNTDKGISKIVFSEIEIDSLKWSLAYLDKDSKHWNVVWEMFMKKMN